MTQTAALVLMLWMMLAVASEGLLAETPASEACPARETLPAQVRPWDCGTAGILNSGIARSATLRRVVDRVGALNGIVYIKSGYYVNGQTRRVYSGVLSHRITEAGAHRVLQVTVAPASSDSQLATMAHELQHAIEVLEATDATTEVAVDRLFERIGMHTRAGIMETQAALDVGSAVARELSANRSASR
jgi:hypothetical protein